MPKISTDILEEWAHNEELTLMQQDEELLLAEAEPVSLLIEFIQRRELPSSKHSVLLDALCVVINENRDIEKSETANAFLRDNQRLFEELGYRKSWSRNAKQAHRAIFGRNPEEK